MPYTPKGDDENAHHGPDSFGHNESEGRRPAKVPMPVDVLPIPARDMPGAGSEEIDEDDDILDQERQRAPQR